MRPQTGCVTSLGVGFIAAFSMFGSIPVEETTKADLGTLGKCVLGDFVLPNNVPIHRPILGKLFLAT
jgi:hypothetical protein